MAFANYKYINCISRHPEGYVFVFYEVDIVYSDTKYVIVDENYHPDYYFAPDEPVDIIYKVVVPDKFRVDVKHYPRICVHCGKEVTILEDHICPECGKRQDISKDEYTIAELTCDCKKPPSINEWILVGNIQEDRTYWEDGSETYEYSAIIKCPNCNKTQVVTLEDSPYFFNTMKRERNNPNNLESEDPFGNTDIPEDPFGNTDIPEDPFGNIDIPEDLFKPPVCQICGKVFCDCKHKF